MAPWSPNPEVDQPLAAVSQADKNFEKLLQVIQRIVSDAREQINADELYR